MTLVHRLIIAVSLALLLIGISIQPPNLNYDRAEREIGILGNVIRVVSEQVDQGYKEIYKQSELRAATLVWLRKHNQRREDIRIQVKTPPDLTVPDSERDPLVTLDAQLKFADRVYRDLDFPILLCDVQRSSLLRALDNLFGASARPEFQELTVYFSRNSVGKYGVSGQQFTCQIELRYGVQLGNIGGDRHAILDLPTAVIGVESNVADAFKDAGLGDFEARESILVPYLWGLWADVGPRSPDAARAFLEQKEHEESEKSKERIEILGESLNRSLTIVMACVVELCLMAYLLAHLLQVRRMLPGHEASLAESPFYGVMCTMFGRVLILLTFVIPLGICWFALVWVLPPISTEWPGPSWVVAWEARWFLAAVLGGMDLLLILQSLRTVALLNAVTELTRVPVVASEEPQK